MKVAILHFLRWFAAHLVRSYLTAIKSGDVTLDGKITRDELEAVLKEIVSPALELIEQIEPAQQDLSLFNAGMEEIKSRIPLLARIIHRD